MPPRREARDRMIVGVTTWGDRVSPVLDVAERLVVFSPGSCAEGGTAIELSGMSMMHRAAAIEASGIDVLICGAVTKPLLAALTRSGMTVVPWVSGAVDEILEAFSCGRLDDRFAMPGCGRGRRRHRRGR